MSDREDLVSVVDGIRYCNTTRMQPSQMIWQCEKCQSQPQVRNRTKYANIKLCIKCSNAEKIKDPKFLEHRGRKISESIAKLGDKWSDIAKKNMSNPETRRKISEKAIISGQDPRLKAIWSKVATENNKKSGFGTKEFTTYHRSQLSKEKRLAMSHKNIASQKATGQAEHLVLVKERYPTFEVLGFGHPDNTYKCEHGHVFSMRGNNFLKRGRCLECAPRSNLELDFYKKALNYIPDLIQNKRILYYDPAVPNGNKAFEVDMYSPSKSFGIEVHGVYYHSEDFTETNYHAQKADLAKLNGVKLLQFFEDEVLDSEDILMSMVRFKAGLVKTIFARKTSIAEVPNSQANDFFEVNHLQGSTRSTKSWALFHEGEMISAISMRMHKGLPEIARFAVKLNHGVTGGFSKLMVEVEKWALLNNFNQIVTFANRRYSEGDVYLKNGFERVSETLDFYWTKGNSRYDRHISWGKSDSEMRENGYRKIYGAGNIKFLKSLPHTAPTPQ